MIAVMRVIMMIVMLMMVQEAECALSHKEEIFNKFIYLNEIVREWLGYTLLNTEISTLS